MTNEETFQYAVKSEGFNMWLCGKHVHAKNGILTLTKKQNDEIRALMADGRVDISSELTYLDIKAAEETAKAYIAKQAPAAHQGTAHSQANVERVETLKEVQGKEPAGMTLKDRLAAQAQNVLANAKEESVSHGEDSTLKEIVKS